MNSPLVLPDAFRGQMQTQLGAEFPAFEQSLTNETPVSIRLNPAKPTGLLNINKLVPVLWCAEGFYLPQRPVFTLDPLFWAGAYYVQEASSMLLVEAMRQIVKPNYAPKVLDLCAAPGGKSTLLASALPSNSLLVCNEVIRTRVPILRENLEKWGFPNVAITNHDPEDFQKLSSFFDIVLVDAPCSGEGLFRKDPDAVQHWSPDAVAMCSARQKRILSQAAPLVDDGGWLIYSTCTYNDHENCENVKFLTENGFRNYPLMIPAEWGIVEVETEGTVGYQCYPHRVRGEGFFMSVFRKTGFTTKNSLNARHFKTINPERPKQAAQAATWLANPADFSIWNKPNGDVMALPKSLEKNMLILDNALHNKGFGLELGQFKGSDFVPSHALALSTAISRDLPGIDFLEDDALRYLKKENLILAEPAKGWLLARYDGLNLGWMKAVGNRVNNYLPNQWRVRMERPTDAVKTEFFD